MVGAALLSFGTSAEATVIIYEVENVSGTTFEYRYVVENDGTDDVEELSIYFELGLFENLRMPDAPAGWDALVLQPDPILVDDGLYDALALVAAIPPGGVLGGFSVWADFLGTGAPGSQYFEIFDPVSFDVLDSGFTVPAVVDVPEPATAWTASLGLLALLAAARRREERSRLMKESSSACASGPPSHEATAGPPKRFAEAEASSARVGLGPRVERGRERGEEPREH